MQPRWLCLFFWGHIWKRTVEKSQTNATNVTLPHLGQTFWRRIWKRTVERRQINVTNVTMYLLRKAVWGNIWKRTVEKSQTKVTHRNCKILWIHHVNLRKWLNYWDGTGDNKDFICLFASANENERQNKLCCCSVFLQFGLMHSKFKLIWFAICLN